MSHATYLIGDVFERMREFPDNSVDLVLTSPPFLALRSYLPDDHPNKAKEIGSEPNPAEFVDTLLALSAEWRRILAPHGSIAVELGDTFSGGGGGDMDKKQFLGGRESAAEMNRKTKLIRDNPGSWPLVKSLALVPEAYRFALAYGHNPYTGTESPAGQWRVRNVIRWVRPNPPVGALGDKFRPATSEMVEATIASDRFFDLDAVRTPTDHDRPGGLRKGTPKGTDERRVQAGESAQMSGSNPAGAPPLDWWKISPKGGYAGAHYAVWPAELCIKPIKTMCPERVCRECGEPSRRITERTPEYAAARAAVGDMNTHATGVNDRATGNHGDSRSAQLGKMTSAQNVTVGWTDCGHNNWRPGIVLDPFAGTGTTLAVATGHGRDAIGIDIDERNALLAEERIGPMFLTIRQSDQRYDGSP